jgi:hypothetical protein
MQTFYRSARNLYEITRIISDTAVIWVGLVYGLLAYIFELMPGVSVSFTGLTEQFSANADNYLVLHTH